MLTGGYTNEFEVVMAGQNGELGQVKWTMYIFWIAMVLMAIIGMNVQISQRNELLNAQKMKGFLNAGNSGDLGYARYYDRLLSSRHGQQKQQYGGMNNY